MYVAGIDGGRSEGRDRTVDRGVIRRLELPVSDVERLSLVGRLSGGFDRCAHKSHGGPLPTSPLQPQVPGTQRGLPVPPGADTDIPLVGAGPGGPSKHATTPPIWGLPGPWTRQHPHRAPPQTGRGFLLGGGTGAHAGRTGFPDPPVIPGVAGGSGAPKNRPKFEVQLPLVVGGSSD